jgi:hypothetical protein
MVWNAKKFDQNFTNWDSLAEAITLFGLDWRGSSDAPPVGDLYDQSLMQDTDVSAILNLQQLAANVDQLSTTGQAYYSLAFLLRPVTLQQKYPKERAIVDRMVTNTLSRMRLQGRTAYIQQSESSTHAAPMQAQALWLMVLSRSSPSDAMTEKLANYVGQGSRPSLWSVGYETHALSALGLSEYDSASQNTSPDVKLMVKSGPNVLLSASFTSPSDPVATSITSMDDMPRSTKVSSTGVIVPTPVDFMAKGEGEVSTALLMNFVPAEVSADPIYRGMYVERSIQHIDEKGDLVQGNTQLNQAGKFVKVTLQITTPDDLVGVEVADLLPGGLEALDPNLQKSVANQPVDYSAPGDYIRPAMIWPPWTNNAFGARETLPDRVKWFANRLPAGTHTVSYEALAVTPGVFLHPPTKASVQSNPGLLGLSGGGYFVVTEDEVVDEQAYLKAHGIPVLESTIPKECSEECDSAAGEACNLRTGTCEPVQQLQQLTLAPRSDRTAAYSSNAVLNQPSSSSIVSVTPVDDNFKVRFLKVYKRLRRAIQVTWVAPAASDQMDCDSLAYLVEYKPLTSTEWESMKVQDEFAIISGLMPSTRYNIKVTATTPDSTVWVPSKIRARTLNAVTKDTNTREIAP